MPGESLREAERGALATLGLILQAHSDVTERAFNRLGLALSLLPQIRLADVRPSRRVVTVLLTRVTNYLRSGRLFHGR